MQALIEREGHSAVAESIRVVLARLRQEISSGQIAGGRLDEKSLELALGGLSAAVERQLRQSLSHSLLPLVNATGVILHTNLGRAPLAAAAVDHVRATAGAYSNLEFDLATGERGKRDAHVDRLFQKLLDDALPSFARLDSRGRLSLRESEPRGSEQTFSTGLSTTTSTIVVNNNAAAVLLALNSLAEGGEVIVSRGELVEIGGSFRVPDVIQQGGAKLREVGTTNRTRARDYATAATKKTAAILRVNRSNFDIVGFTETPSIEELVEVARSKKMPLLYDEGSGRVVDVSKYGFRRRETIRELIARGVDVITCSTDKLIGATQGGLIVGRAQILEKIRKHPLMRALRAGKESYAVIAETLRAFAIDRHEQDIAIYRMLATPIDALRANAESIVRGTRCRVIESQCALGGGTTPTETIPSIAIEVPGKASKLAARFLHNDPPIVGRIEKDRFTLEVRTLLDADRPVVAAALRTTSG
jgi:L-seryl-tRNA(Ser) seleniumtransferase